MLYSELITLTHGQCTPEEFAAIDAVYMSLEDMTKPQAAALWRRLYGRRHREAAAAESARLHSLEYISTLRPGDRVMIPGVGQICITADAYEDYNRHMRRNILFYPGTSVICPQPVYLGWISSGDWHIVNGNPARLTKGGRVIA